MELTTLDRELLDGLQVLTDLEISRVQAHLAAGLPMRIAFGWEEMRGEEPACFGCVVGTAMGGSFLFKPQYPRRVPLLALAYTAFPFWARNLEGWPQPHVSTHAAPETQPGMNDRRLSKSTLDRLAAILDMEWSRRVMATSNPVEQTHDSAIIPSLEAVPV